MQKTFYVLLFLITTALIGYTGYYVFTHQNGQTAQASATTTPQVLTPVVENPKNILTTKTGKKITIKETNPAGESLSTITITPEGFATNTPLTLERNKLTDFFLTDMNNDTYDELVIITTASGSGSYGELDIFTTSKDAELIPVTIPKITEDDTKRGSLFEGYMGHDSFVANNGTLVREFPIYTKTDTNENPTGGKQKILYTLTEKDNLYTITFTKIEAPKAASSTVGIKTTR